MEKILDNRIEEFFDDYEAFDDKCNEGEYTDVALLWEYLHDAVRLLKEVKN